MDIGDKNNFTRLNEAKSFTSAFADMAGCTIYQINNADRMANIMFIAHEPIPYVDVRGEISKQDYEKVKVASITMTYGQAKNFYESLKRQFENE